jgi:starch synthase
MKTNGGYEMQNRKGLKILFVSAEVSPFAKTGGLADVAGSLPQTLAAMGNDVRVVMPRYKMIKTGVNYVADFPVQMEYRKETCVVRESELCFKNGQENGRVPVYFLDNYHYYDRDGIYCYFDDAERFIFLCKAVLEMLPAINFQPDIIHCNDWHTGPICMLLKEKYNKLPFYSKMATVFTIHTLEYQGNFPREVARFFNMGEDILIPDKAEFYGMFGFMKTGLVYSDIINTVSEKYAREIKTPQYGEKLEGLLQQRADRLSGIVNGISYEEFDPSSDPRIYRNYDASTPELKKENKYALQREMGLPVGDMPVIGLVSRLTGQKGLNLVMEEMDEILKDDVQFVLLGAGDEYYETAFKNLKLKYPDKVGVFVGFNAPLAQRIYAGSDMFLMPSRFEPCGLGQIISLRYGTIPIVRATGGLAETVIDVDANPRDGNGFTFEEFSSEQMRETVERALKVYNEKPEEWKQLVVKALKSDFSWNRPAEKYLKLYEMAMEKRV